MRNDLDALLTALTLRRRRLVPVPLHPPGAQIRTKSGVKTATGKEPTCSAWGEAALARTDAELEALYLNQPALGLGILLGPKGGVIDMEGDGPEAERSLRELFDGEPPPTLGWSSRRGSHRLYRWDERLSSIGKAKLEPAELPDLEVRLGCDGQAQSACPPSLNEDGRTPRRWNGCDTIAALPEAVIARLLDLARPRPRRAGLVVPAGDSAARWFAKALQNVAGRVAMAGVGERHDRLRDETKALAGYLHFGYFSEAELHRTMIEAGNRAEPGEAAKVADTVEWAIAVGKAEPLPWPEKLSRPDGASEAGSKADSGANLTEAPDLITTCLADIRPMPVRFLVPGVIPLGKLIALAGLGGSGKGTLYAAFVADLSRGRPALGLSYVPPGPADVLLVGCEDGYADTVVPRLLAADADLTRIHRLDGIAGADGKPAPFSLAHYAALERYLERCVSVRLVVIDPITGYVGRAGINEYKDAELRAVLEPLAELSDRRGVTVLIIKHLTKDEARSVLGRVGGSVAYVNVPRACFLVASDPDSPAERRLLLPFKWNLNAPWPDGSAFRLEAVADDARARILAECGHLTEDQQADLAGQLLRPRWDGAVTVSADEVMRAGGRAERSAKASDNARAVDWLRERLANGPIASVLCAREGDATLGRAWKWDGVANEERRRFILGRVKWWREGVLKAKLGGRTRKVGMDGPWFFVLPEQPWPPPPEAIAVARAEESGETAEGGEESEGSGDNGWAPSGPILPPSTGEPGRPPPKNPPSSSPDSSDPSPPSRPVRDSSADAEVVTGPPGPLRSNVQCSRFCPGQGRRWWRSVHGVVLCRDCHAPASPDLVAETGGDPGTGSDLTSTSAEMAGIIRAAGGGVQRTPHPPGPPPGTSRRPTDG